MRKFEVGKTYTGSGHYGDCEMKVIKRTEKTVTIETLLGTSRTKLRAFHTEYEVVSHKGWQFWA